MNRYFWVMFGIFILGLSGVNHASDRTGSLGLNYTLGPSFILGGEGANDASSVEPGVGAGLTYGFSPQISLRFDYDYIDASLHSQALTFGGQYYFQPNSAWSPFAGAGIGFGKPFSGEGWDHFSMKLSGGLERELTPEFTLGPVVTYQFIDGTEPFGSIHTMTFGARLTYYFGAIRR